MTKNSSWKQIVIAALLGSMAYLLMYIAFPIIPIVPYITLDFSGIPILLAFYLFGRKSGYIALITKEILHMLLTGISVVKLIGISADALALICLAELFLSVLHNKRKRWIMAVGISTIGMTIIMSLANYFIITPAYMKLLGIKLSFSLAKFIVVGVVPFNLIKGGILGLVTSLLSVRLQKLVVKVL